MPIEVSFAFAEGQRDIVYAPQADRHALATHPGVGAPAPGLSTPDSSLPQH